MKKPVICRVCECRLDKVAIGLNKKLLNDTASTFFCVDCLSAHIDISVEDLYAKAEELKEQGCTLFL